MSRAEEYRIAWDRYSLGDSENLYQTRTGAEYSCESDHLVVVVHAESLRERAHLLRNGQWDEASAWNFESADFGSLFKGRPHGVVLVAKACVSDETETQQVSVRIEYDEVYRATAIPVAEAVEFLRSRQCPRGVHFLGDTLPVDDFLSGMTKRGMRVNE